MYLCGTNFSEVREIRSIQRKSIPKKFSVLGLFAKVDSYKEFFFEFITKINKRLVA